MNGNILQAIDALAETWVERGNDKPEAEDGSESAQYGNGMAEGRREQLCHCADELRRLVELLTP